MYVKQTVCNTNSVIADYLEMHARIEELSSGFATGRVNPNVKGVCDYIRSCGYSVIDDKIAFSEVLSQFGPKTKEIVETGLGEAEGILYGEGKHVLAERTRDLAKGVKSCEDALYYRKSYESCFKRKSSVHAHSSGRFNIIKFGDEDHPLSEPINWVQVREWTKQGKIPYCGMDGKIAGYLQPTRLLHVCEDEE